MLKKLLLVVALLMEAVATAAPMPPDIATSTGYTPVTPTYQAGTTLNAVGDGSSNAGTPPAAAYELADVPTVEAGWTTTAGAAAQPLTNANGGTAPEAKFRTQASGKTKILFDDPIRNYGQPGTSHCHEFFGNLSANAYSTFATLRSRARKYGMAAGGPLNGTAYWFPCVTDQATGNVIRPKNTIIIYYVNNPALSPKVSPLYRGLRYVVGTNMDDPDLTWLQARIDVANSQPGTSPTRYSLTHSGNYSWTQEWTCSSATPSTARRLKNSDGSDPFGGTCVAGSDFWMQFAGANCWDGQNFWSDSGNPGYRHVIPKIWDNVAGDWVCPDHWYLIPSLTLQIHFSQNGFSDYGNWRLSSDDAMQAKLTALGTPRAVNNGES
jgi:hypothetical protein